MGISKVTRNYQISIPKDVRAELKLSVGDVVLVKREGERIIVELLKEKDIVKETFGLWGKSKIPGWKVVKRLRKEAEEREKRLGI